jgi:hypothetical protein
MATADSYLKAVGDLPAMPDSLEDRIARTKTMRTEYSYCSATNILVQGLFLTALLTSPWIMVKKLQNAVIWALGGFLLSLSVPIFLGLPVGNLICYFGLPLPFGYSISPVLPTSCVALMSVEGENGTPCVIIDFKV